jgi:hypothetical protein
MQSSIYTGLLILAFLIWGASLVAHYLDIYYAKKRAEEAKQFAQAIREYLNLVPPDTVQSVPLGEGTNDDQTTSPTSAKGK